MTIDAFADRLGRVRQRFVSTLQGKIDGAFESVAKVADVRPGATAAVGEIYRSMHGMVGVGQAVGFPITGRAAHDAEDTLRSAQHDGRGLRPDEVLLFKQRLSVLREAAMRELQIFHSATA
jgi:chemotaxis protein histidine kinase CheA